MISCRADDAPYMTRRKFMTYYPETTHNIKMMLGANMSTIEDSNSHKFDDYLREHDARLIPDDFFSKTDPSLKEQFPNLFYKGNLEILRKPCVSVVGTRTPAQEGVLRAQKVVSILTDMDFVVLSGLAKGIDTTAHTAALNANGLTAAVLGTPIHKIYPAENKRLAEDIICRGLLLSPSLPHEEKGRYLFPRRNILMARLSKATVIIEAGETSGVVHQAAECLRQGQTLILLKSLVANPSLT